MGIIAIVFEILKFAWGPIGLRIGYVKNLKKNMEELNKEAEFLFAARDDVEEKITSSKLKGATRQCNQWLEKVKLTEHHVDAIRKESEEDKKCFAGCCPNVYSRMKLGKCVKDILKEINDLNNKLLTFDGKELSDAPLEKVESQNIDINSSTTIECTLQKIVGDIKDATIQRIGLWGMGGVGKTTTLKLLNNRPEVFQTFEIIIWVTVSRDGSQRKVQNEIAERLKLKLSNESDDRLRAGIYHTLRKKKFLLLLDDLWERIDLSDIGIPTLNEDNGCKVVLTTRSLGVCRQMKTDDEIKVETLSKDEAWQLFIENAGGVAMSPHIEPTARWVVEECGGLPLAIIVVGSLLRKNSDVVVWRNTLRELQLPTTSQIEDMEERVFRCLRLSYDRLQDDCKKRLFLYCSFYPEDYEILITELVEYCWLEGYIQGVGSIEEARDKGHYMVMNLADASLLERCHKERYVKMHDVIRDFALREGCGFLIKAGMNDKHPPEEKEWLQLQKMSLMRSSLCRLLLKPNCSSMSTLLLQYNIKLTMIPDPFFEFMHSLVILDLSGINLKLLPSSLWDLVNLRGLYLKDCKELEYIPSQVKALKRLEVLHLGGCTMIKYLPREVGELISLKRLIVRFQECYVKRDLKLRIPTGIIPNLPLLEELSLSTHACVEKEQWDDESMEVVIDELCRLEHLTYLDVYFPRVECLEYFLHQRKSWQASWFRRFRFRVCPEKEFERNYFREHDEWERCLVYKGGHGVPHVVIMETLAHCTIFHLENHHTVERLSEFGMTNMNELKECRLICSGKMETLFNGEEELEITSALLPNLEELEVNNLPNWRSLWDGPWVHGSLSKLTNLLLNGCDHLKKVFQLGIIRQLPSLENLRVADCSSLEEIIGVEEEMSVPDHVHNNKNGRVILPKMKSIILFSLPELVSICPGVSLEWPSLETITIIECHKLRSLFSITHGTNYVPPALKKIVGKSSWWEALEWEDNGIKQRIQPFFSEQ